MESINHAAMHHVPSNKGKLVGQKAPLESTVRYLGIDVNDAPEIAEQTDI